MGISGKPHICLWSLTVQPSTLLLHHELLLFMDLIVIPAA